LIIKSDYQYATMSITEKQEDRYDLTVTQCNEFMDRFPDSKLKPQVQEYVTATENQIKILKSNNEQVKKAS
jgi:outer membrane protein assembly factor BamD